MFLLLSRRCRLATGEKPPDFVLKRVIENKGLSKLPQSRVLSDAEARLEAADRTAIATIPTALISTTA